MIVEARVLASLIYEGILEDFPGLRIIVSHGGGYLPHDYRRRDRNVHNLPESTVHISEPPSAYPLMGSNWPVGEADPVAFVEGCAELSAGDREAILGGTAASLLGLA